jgi:two-component system phosphate regulon sensor histidine kinase PhoR
LRRFITDASHELRTPITALKNFNALLLEPSLSDPETRREFLTENQVQIERLEWITSNLLDLSRLDSRLIPLDIEEHDLREIVKTVVGMFRKTAEEKEIKLSLKVPDYEVLYPCDRFRLEIALSNLVENALKYTQKGGEVEIGIHDQDALLPDREDLFDDQGGVQIWVRDNGVGILAEDLPHIFERFYRGNVSDESGQSEAGSGLGLAIVKSIVEAHNGRVDVESTPGDGTIFRIKLEAG